MKKPVTLLAALLCTTAVAHAQMPALPSFRADTVSILECGAVPDGVTLNTVAINGAIDAMAKKGGGTVLIPAGIWLTGPIIMRSGINLHAERGAIVMFSTDFSLYPPDGKGKRQTPVYGEKLHDIAFTGEGIYDGNGQAWRPVKKSKYTASEWKGFLAKGFTLNEKGDIAWPPGTNEANDDRPYLLVLKKCRQVLFDGPTFRNSPKFVLNPQDCHGMTIRNLFVFNEWNAQNGDGIDISGGSDILIERCTVSVGDDAICMKSSGSRADGPFLHDVLIRDCTVYRGHGGFVIGSNTDGGIADITVQNCSFIGTDTGLRFKSARDRGGVVENIRIDSIRMKDIVGEAIVFETGYEDVTASGVRKNGTNAKIPRFRNFRISNVICTGAGRSLRIEGLPEAPVENIFLENVNITAAEPAVEINCRNIVKTASAL